MHPFNPAGLGFVTDRLLDTETSVLAPQIGDLAEFMAADIRAQMTVHRRGPIAKSWLPRRSEAGVFDDLWKATRPPGMPKDHSFGFWNAAPRRLQIDPHPRGGERMVLQDFRFLPEPQSVVLPAVGLTLRTPDGTVWPMNLTDVQIDMEAEDPTPSRVVLIWRRFLGSPEGTDVLHIETATLGNCHAGGST